MLNSSERDIGDVNYALFGKKLAVEHCRKYGAHYLTVTATMNNVYFSCNICGKLLQKELV